MRTAKYRATPHAKRRRQELRKTPKAKQKVREYNARPEVKARNKRYQATDKARRLKKKRQGTAKYKQKAMEYDQNRRASGYYEQPHIKQKRDEYFSKPEIVNLRNQRKSNQRKIDPGFRLKCNISTSIWQSLKRNKSSKSSCIWEKLVGYTLKELKGHLEKLFLNGMTWANYGEWHIDHVVPVVAFDFSNPFQSSFKECWALSNLQPLWAVDNKKKGAKITNSLRRENCV